MSVPEIPGFYFDTSRKRYFKIVNGDQRHNSSYSNNVVRAEERRKEYNDTDCTKRSKTPDKLSQMSLNSENKRHSLQISDWLVRKKLGNTRSNPGPMDRFMLSSCALKLFSTPVWPSSKPGMFFSTNGPSLELHGQSGLVNGNRLEPIASLCFMSVESPNEQMSKRIDKVEAKGDWAFCVHGQSLSLSRWQWVDTNQECHVEDYTNRLMSSLSLHHSMSENGLSKKLMSSKLFACFDNDALVLYSVHGYEIVVCLEPFCIRSINVIGAIKERCPQNDSVFLLLKTTLYYNSGKYLVASISGHKTKTWKFDAPVYKYYATLFEAKNVSGEKEDLVRLFIVTAKEVIIRDVGNHSLRSKGSDVIIPVRNDNQARPLISKQDQHILVEESEGIFKVIDTM
ncbi:hypothetical protein JCM33374_g5450 [Metschnikowia sp. JCM 33374]|nr:hypothetical protein JCM33374_g5450 [Metschnikowia sp. JCM 33374]